MDKHIYFIRHGQTDYNKLGIVQGSGVDSDLNEIGIFQANQFHNFYSDKINFDIIIHSALKRTRQTVHPFIQKGISALSDSRINEMSWGDHEGKQGNPEIGLSYKKLIEAWQNNDLDARIPNGESALDLYNRLTEFTSELRYRTEQNILVCSHGRALRCLICILKGQPLREMESYKLSNTGLYIAQQVNDNFTLLAENDLSHRTPLLN